MKHDKKKQILSHLNPLRPQWDISPLSSASTYLYPWPHVVPCPRWGSFLPALCHCPPPCDLLSSLSSLASGCPSKCHFLEAVLVHSQYKPKAIATIWFWSQPPHCDAWFFCIALHLKFSLARKYHIIFSSRSVGRHPVFSYRSVTLSSMQSHTIRLTLHCCYTV